MRNEPSPGRSEGSTEYQSAFLISSCTQISFHSFRLITSCCWDSQLPHSSEKTEVVKPFRPSSSITHFPNDMNHAGFVSSATWFCYKVNPSFVWVLLFFGFKSHFQMRQVENGRKRVIRNLRNSFFFFFLSPSLVVQMLVLLFLWEEQSFPIKIKLPPKLGGNLKNVT